MSAPAPCPICASTRTRLHRDDVRDLEYFVATERAFAIRACEACASQYLDPRPSEAEVRSFYPDDYHAYHPDHGVIARALVSLRARLRGRHYRKLAGGLAASLFDVGAGDCRHFKELERFGDFEFGGVEIQPEIAARARAAGYDVVTGMLETLDLEPHRGRYDIVSMNHLIEHVIQPRVVAQRAFELLKPGGCAIGQLPTVDAWEARLFGRYWGGYHYPRHLQAFSRRGLADLLAQAGFVDVVVKSAPHIQTTLSVQNALVGTGWRPRMQFGKTPVYGALMALVLPFELAALFAGKTGIVDFEARRPA